MGKLTSKMLKDMYENMVRQPKQRDILVSPEMARKLVAVGFILRTQAEMDSWDG